MAKYNSLNFKVQPKFKLQLSSPLQKVPLQVDWYQPGAGAGAGAFGGAALGENDFSYDAPSTSAGTFGTFEEEEPLLQGES